jgi:hypothetical protein
VNVLTVERLNRTLLLRQGLLERVPRPIPAVIERMGGIQNQYAPNGYIALWSRVSGFRREHLTRALRERRVIQATLMRGTIHLVSARDYHPMAAGVRRAQRDWWSRIARSRGLDDVSYADVAGAVTELLSTGPLRRDEILAGLAGQGFQGSTGREWRTTSTWCGSLLRGHGSAGAPTSTPSAPPGSATVARRRRRAFGC